ncbi:hypothetical protein Salat_2593600 [Sesamum alatum]|uniref:Uncharacterized protein n=1 Tax=Sesamum alatum TaxID=300844 RepID=A0AAE1XN12_9LAMI|nr:hypothetical protein Salat_2593600 [Sesamum alatum]
MAFWGMVFLVLIFLPMTLAAFAWADTVLLSEDVADLRDQGGAVSQSEAAELELRRLKSKISYLETLIEDRTAEVKRTDGGIKQLEKVIEEKSNSLASLQTAEKESLEVREQIGEVNARANELEKQILNLKKEIEAQNRKKDELESQANAAEEKIEELKLKLENLQKINNEQKSRIHKAQRALQAAEEEMLKAKVEASSMTKQLKEVHRAWLPSWLSTHLVHCQSFVLTLWNQIGRPVFNPTIQEALKQKYEVEKWLQHHLETIKRKWFPIIIERYNAIVYDFHPLLQSFSTQAFHYYHVAQSTIKPHIMNIQETVDPYFQEAKIFLKPYVDQVAEITKPHLDKACLFLKPFSKKVIYYHKKIYKNVQVYHSLAQATLHETLNSYELTKPLATEGLVQFMTSILIVLSVIVLFRTLRWKEPKKRHHSSNRSHTRRRAKRANASK